MCVFLGKSIQVKKGGRELTKGSSDKSWPSDPDVYETDDIEHSSCGLELSIGIFCRRWFQSHSSCAYQHHGSRLKHRDRQIQMQYSAVKKKSVQKYLIEKLFFFHLSAKFWVLRLAHDGIHWTILLRTMGWANSIYLSHLARRFDFNHSSCWSGFEQVRFGALISHSSIIVFENHLDVHPSIQRNLLTAICRWHCGCIYFVFPMIKWYHTRVVFLSERLLLSQNAKMSLSDDLFEQSYPPESWNRQPRCAIEQINKYCLTHTNWISNLSNVIEEMSLQKDARALKIWRHRCVKNMDVHLYFFKLLCEWVSAFCNEHLIFFFY